MKFLQYQSSVFYKLKFSSAVTTDFDSKFKAERKAIIPFV